MYYSSIEIKPKAFEDGYRVDYYELPYNKESVGNRLHSSLGFYHFSRKKKPSIAFKELKEAMIQERLNIITNLVKDIEALHKLTL